MVTTASTTQKKRALSYEKGLSRPKDVNAPKRPLTAYFQWAAENRVRVQEECNSSNVAEVTKKLGEMWRSLEASEKNEWEEKAKTELDTYKDKFATYKETSDYESFEKSLREYNIKMTYKPFKKDENMPKRPLSAYMLFAADERPKLMKKNEGAKLTEVIKLVADAWKKLSDTEKSPYTEKAKKLSEEHVKHMEVYNNSAERVKYLEEKEDYKKRMAAKRLRLMKQAGMVEVEAKGSGATPGKKRAKKSDPKKKKSSAKKASGKKKASKSKKKSAPKKSSAKKKKTSAKKKVSKPKKKSAPKKAKKAKAADTKSKK